MDSVVAALNRGVKIMVEGMKFDKNKPRLAEMLLDFQEPIEELCKVWEFGANKYGKSNWKKLDNGKDRFLNALYRHSFAAIKNNYDESSFLHASHMVFNSLAYLYYTIKELNKEEKQ